jgi:hypothetical protein
VPIIRTATSIAKRPLLGQTKEARPHAEEGGGGSNEEDSKPSVATSSAQTCSDPDKEVVQEEARTMLVKLHSVGCVSSRLSRTAVCMCLAPQGGLESSGTFLRMTKFHLINSQKDNDEDCLLCLMDVTLPQTDPNFLSVKEGHVAFEVESSITIHPPKKLLHMKEASLLSRKTF